MSHKTAKLHGVSAKVLQYNFAFEVLVSNVMIVMGSLNLQTTVFNSCDHKRWKWQPAILLLKSCVAW